MRRTKRRTLSPRVAAKGERRRVRPAWRTTFGVKVPLTTCQEEGFSERQGRRR